MPLFMNIMAPKEDENVAQYYIGLLREGQLEPIERDLDPSLKDPNFHNTMVKVAGRIPHNQPASVKLVGCDVFKASNLRRINLTYEFQFSDQWMLINVATQKKKDVFTIIGMGVLPIADSLENLNRFTLFGKRIRNYLVLLWGLATACFIFYALVLCIRTKIKKRKWLWILFILFAVGELSINWTTGQFKLNPVSVQLFGFSAFANGYGPWIINVGFPLGAFLFLLRRRKITGNKSSVLDATSPQL